MRQWRWEEVKKAMMERRSEGGNIGEMSKRLKEEMKERRSEGEKKWKKHEEEMTEGVKEAIKKEEV